MSVDRLFDVKDRVIIITGGLGQLGRQFTGALLARGAKVAVWDITADSEVVAKAFGELAESPELFCQQADITSRASLEAALAKLTAKWGAPFGLVNNAALDSPPDSPPAETGPFEGYPEDLWDRVMEVNLKGTFLACQVAGGAMAQAGRGSIINVSSMYGVVSPDQSLYEYRRQRGETFFKPVAYSASKSGLLNLSRYLATYWAGQGVRVNTLVLGGVFNGQEPDFLEGYAKRSPLGRMAKEDEYNGAVVFLLSDSSSYMTGSQMVLDGGWTAW